MPYVARSAPVTQRTSEPASETLRISDHALVRYMQRAHGVDIDAWRRIMRADLDAALAGFDGHPARYGPAFIVGRDGVAITYVGDGDYVLRGSGGATSIPRCG